MSGSAEEEFQGTDRFAVRRRLGSGAYGVVYEVFDAQHGAVVALKALRRWDPSALYLFKQEFRSLADLVHPNLVSLYELLTEGDRWFFTMEFIDGRSFSNFVRGKSAWDGDSSSSEGSTQIDPRASDTTVCAPSLPPQDAAEVALPFPSDPLYPARLRNALRQLATGVQALHQAGKLHQDLKPSNVLVTGEERVVVLDFGLSIELVPSGPARSRTMAGTPAYMAPEQAGRGRLSEASDWYSVGVMLFECLTGRCPFVGESLEVLAEKARREAPSPADFVTGIPADLGELCRRLLRRDPAERLSGRDVLRLLEEPGATSRASGPSRSPERRDAVFVGRERDLGLLMEAFAASQPGHAVTVYVHGSSGMGKSALVRHFLAELEDREANLVVMSGRCYEQESVPYKALDSLIDALSQYLKRLDRDEAEALMPPGIGALARIFPVLLQVEAVSSSRRKLPEIPDSRELRRRAFIALRELFARVARRHPLIVFIDDLQWGDADSAAILLELLRPPDPPALLFIGAYRTEDSGTSPLLRALLARGPVPEEGGADSREIPLSPLSASEARDLAVTLVGEAGRAEQIAREAGGSPFFIDELARHAAAASEVTARGATLDSVLRARVERLPETARRLLETVAVAGRPIDRMIARQAAEIGGEEQAAVSLLRAANLIRPSGASGSEQIESYHDRIRETVVSHLPARELRARHARLAEALEGSGKADPESLTLHFQGAGLTERAAGYAAEAAGRAAQALAFDRAARLYRLALDLRGAAGPDARSLRALLGDALANAGRGAEAAEAYLAAARDSSASESLDLSRRAAEQMLRSGYIDGGLETLRGVLEEAGMKLAATPALALLSLLWRRLRIRLRGLQFRERDAAGLPAEELMRIDTCWAVSVGLSQVDTIRGADFQARHLLLALDAGEPYRVARALALEAGHASTAGASARPRVRRLLAAAREIAERLNNPHALALADLNAGVAAYMEGAFRDSVERLGLAEKTLRERCTGVAWELNTVQLYALRGLFFLGWLRELERRAPAFLKDARERGDLYAETHLRTRISYVSRLLADEPVRARQELEEAMARWSHSGFHLQHFWELVGHVEIALYAGDGGGAWRAIRESWKPLRRSLLLRVQVARVISVHLRGRAAVAAGGPAALAAALRDARRIEKEDAGWSRPLALSLSAAVACGRQRRGEAKALLEAAEKGFSAAEMALFTAAARRARGMLVGGDDGRALVEEADDWMIRQRIRKPDRIAAMLLPGGWGPP